MQKGSTAKTAKRQSGQTQNEGQTLVEHWLPRDLASSARRRASSRPASAATAAAAAAASRRSAASAAAAAATSRRAAPRPPPSSRPDLPPPRPSARRRDSSCDADPDLHAIYTRFTRDLHAINAPAAAGWLAA
jgi:hypothetical protein